MKQNESVFVLIDDNFPTPPAGYSAVYPKSNGFWYRKNSAGEEIRLSDAVGGGVFEGIVVFNKVITPPAITGDANNYAPTGYATCNLMEISSTGITNVTGISSTGIIAGQQIVIANVGANPIRFKHQNGNSLAANRFIIPGGSFKSLPTGETIVFIYSTTLSRWLML